MKIKNSLLILLAGVFWGSMGVFVHLLTDYFGFNSLHSACFRMVSAAFILALFLTIRNKKLFAIKMKDIPLLAANGILSIFFMTVFYFASISSDTSMSVSAVLLYTAPFIVMLLSCVFLGEKLTVQKIVCLVIAFCGCCLVSMSEKGYSTVSGIIFGVLSGVAYALYSIFGSMALKKYHPYTVTFYSFFFAAAASVVMAIVTDMPSAFGTANNLSLLVFAVLATGLVTAVFPFLLYTAGLNGTSPSKASIMAYAEPVSACIFGYFLMDEKMTSAMIAGICLTLLSIILLNINIRHRKKNVLVSRCLLGDSCRYDGQSKVYDTVSKILDKFNVIPVCPEVDGGLETPRNPSEIRGDKVIMNNGKDVTEAFRKGAENALKLAKEKNCRAALLKAKSPSCGKDKVYDGSFTGKLTDGDGVTAKLLKEHSIAVFTENETDELLKFLEENK